MMLEVGFVGQGFVGFSLFFALHTSHFTLREITIYRKDVIQMEDFCYWVFMGGYLFVQIYHTSSGSVRWYYVLGVVVGACLMSWLLRKVKKMCKKIYTRKT